MTHPFAHLPTEFVGFRHGSSIRTPEEKTADFCKKFGAPSDFGDYHPLLLVDNSSCSGEMAHSFGLFVKDGALFDVYGSECSVWNFNGQWQPKQTSTAVLLHRLDNSYLGQEGDDDSQFAEPLRAILEWVDSAIEKRVLLNALAQGAHTNPVPKKI